MPIYEFYCSRCHAIYNFFSKSVNTAKVPSCPVCKNKVLTRQMSVFAAITGGAKEAGAEDLPSGFDEAKLEKAMMALACDAEKINEDDPRAAAQLMRKLAKTTGLPLGDGFEEALARLEAGEDPDKIDEEMGELLSGDDPFGASKSGKKARSLRPPRHEDTLYDL